MDPKVLVKERARRPAFWQELNDYVAEGHQLDFSPWGLATINIPEFFRECIARAGKEMEVLDFQYQKTHGTDGIKKAIVDAFAPIAHFPNCHPERNVAVGIGAITLIEYILHMHIRSQDDEFLTFEPVYPFHFLGLRDKGVGICVKSFYNAQTNRFELDMNDFRSKLNAKTKLVVLCNPNNPTARIFTRQEYQQITDILNEFPHVKVIEDAAYCVYVNGKDRITYFHEVGDNIHKTFTVFSAGKVFNTTGNRLGWIFAHEQLIQNFRLFTNEFYYPSAMEMRVYELAMIESLKPYQGFPTFWEFHSHDNAERLVYLTKGLAKLGVKHMVSEGSYYLLISADKLAKHVEPEYFRTYGPNTQSDPSRDAAVARKLLFKHNVGTYPLSRITFTDGRHDEWIRVAFNRSYEHLDLFLSKIELILRDK